MEDPQISESTIIQIKSLLLRPEYFDPLLEKSYKMVKMKNRAVLIDDYKLFLKHFCGQCGVPMPDTDYVNTFLLKCKEKGMISQEEFKGFFKDYLTKLVPKEQGKKK